MKEAGFISPVGRGMPIDAPICMLFHSARWSWLKAWAMQIARHRGMKEAIVALARRGGCR